MRTKGDDSGIGSETLYQHPRSPSTRRHSDSGRNLRIADSRRQSYIASRINTNECWESIGHKSAQTVIDGESAHQMIIAIKDYNLMIACDLAIDYSPDSSTIAYIFCLNVFYSHKIV